MTEYIFTADYDTYKKGYSFKVQKANKLVEELFKKGLLEKKDLKVKKEIEK